jgi:TP901 family phage tail tape measure protein
MGAKDFESIGDRLAKAANMSTVSVANLGESLTEVGLVARTAGMSLEQTLGTLAMMGEKGGLRGSKAGTGLKAVLSAIAKPSPKSANALKAVGLTDKDVAGAFADLPGFFEKMQSKMDRLHMTTTQRAKLLFTVFQQEGAGAAATLLKNVDALREYNREVKNADGALTTVSDALDQTTEWKLKKFTAAVDEAKITLAEKLAPALHRNLPVAASAAASALDMLGDNLGTISVLGGAWGASLATSAVASIGTSLAAGFTSLGGSATVLAAMTAAGTTIGATFAAALVAAVGGYAGMSAILSMTQDQQRGANVMHDAGASLYDLFSGTSIQRASHRGTIDIGGTPDSGDPMTSGDLPLSSSSAGVAEVGGMITVVVDDQRKPRVITESRGPVGLRVGHNPSGVGKFQ